MPTRPQRISSQLALREIKGLAPPRKGRSAEALLALGERAETTQVIRLVPTPVDYWICTTVQRERMFREYFLRSNPNRPLLETYRDWPYGFPEDWLRLQSSRKRVLAR